MMRHDAQESRTAGRMDWAAYAACIVAFASLAIALLFGVNPYIRENAGSDFKTLYASAWCFVHGIDAYQLPNLADVFHLNRVIEPRSWYGHSPVYPPLTLALLAPITLLPMVPAIYAWIILGCVSMGLATAALVHSAGRIFHLGLPWKILLVALATASPLLEIGLELANVSVVSAAFCTFAIAAPKNVNGWLRAGAVAIALLLKPHIALWIAIAFLFSKARQDRAVILRTAILVVVFLAFFACWGLVHHFALSQFGSYRQIVLSEINNGSMSPGNQDVMEVFVQITSLSSLLGYWFWQHPVAPIISSGVVLVFGVALAVACWRSRSATDGMLMKNAAAWSAFGLMATYHRDADAMIMIVVLPALLARLRLSVKDLWAWSVLAGVIAASVGPSIGSLHSLVDAAPASNIFRFLLLRQASIAAAFLTILLTGEAWIRLRHPMTPSPNPNGLEASF